MEAHKRPSYPPKSASVFSSDRGGEVEAEIKDGEEETVRGVKKEEGREGVR